MRGKGTTINLHQRIISKNNARLLKTFPIMDNSDYNKVENKGTPIYEVPYTCLS